MQIGSSSFSGIMGVRHLGPSESSGSNLFSSAAKKAMGAIDFQRTKYSGERYSDRLTQSAQKLLESSASLIEGSSTSVFSKRTISSSNSSAFTGSAENGASMRSFRLSVDKQATSQGIVSDAATANEKILNPPRKYFRFQIVRGTETTEISVKIKTGDTGEKFLQRIADKINDADAGLAATLDKNTKAGTVRLEIQGIDASDMKTTTFRDVSGNLTDLIGLSTTKYATETTGGLMEVDNTSIVHLNNGTYQVSGNRFDLYANSGTYRFVDTGNGMTAQELYDSWVENGGSLPSIMPSGFRSGAGLLGEHLASIDLKGADLSADGFVEVKQDSEAVQDAITNFIDARNEAISVVRSSLSEAWQTIGNFLEDSFSARNVELKNAGVKEDRDDDNEKYNYTDSSMIEENVEDRYVDIKSLFGGPGGLGMKTAAGALKLAYAPLVQVGSRAEATIFPTTGFGYSGFWFDNFM